MFLSHILDLVFPPRETELLVRHASIGELSRFLAPALVSLHGQVVTALLPYKEPLVKACIIEAKFYKNKKAFELLASTLAQHLMKSKLEKHTLSTRHTIFVPLPLSLRRKRERGYNQVEEVVARALKLMGGGGEMRTNILKRVRDTVPQTTLAKNAREENMRSAFSVHGRCSSSYHFILIDDVVTTGATLAAAFDAFAHAGAVHIRAIALAH